MKVHVESIFDCSTDEAWNHVTTVKLLYYVIYPLAEFRLSFDTTSTIWLEDHTYIGDSYLLGFIPIGKRSIYLQSINPKNYQIQSRENGEIGLKKWDHLLSFKSLPDEKCLYTDTIEIEAGPFTIFYWLFAQIFYHHRHKRWKILIANGFVY